MNQSTMPKGVEHSLMAREAENQTLVNQSTMPKGVEHAVDLAGFVEAAEV